MKKRRYWIAALMLSTMLTVSACGNTDTSKPANTKHETESSVTTNEITVEPETIEPNVVEPQSIELTNLEPLVKAGIITGIEDLKIAEGTEITLNDLVFTDETIVKSVDIDDSKVDYSKVGTYEVVYTITFDGEKLRAYIKENAITVDFDTTGETIVVKTTLTVKIMTKAETKEDNTEVVTNENKSEVQNKNAAEAAPTAKPSSSSNKNNSGNKNSGSGNSGSNSGSGTSKPSSGNQANNGSANTTKPSGGSSSNENKNDSTIPTIKPSTPTPTPTPKPVHKHSYTSSVTKQPTCSDTGVKTYKCACGDSYTESIPATGSHNWQHHEEKGHYETVVIQEAKKEPIYESITYCNGCGKAFTGPNQVDDAIEHDILECGDGYHTEENIVGYNETPAVTEQRWVVDQKAYDSCTVCGTRK